MVELSFAHPLVQTVHQAEQLIKRIDDEEQWLIAIDLEGLMDRPFELKRRTLDVWRLDAVFNFAVGTKEAAAVDFQSIF